MTDAVMNLARKLGMDPERQFRATMHRFRDRFLQIEMCSPTAVAA